MEGILGIIYSILYLSHNVIDDGAIMLLHHLGPEGFNPLISSGLDEIHLFECFLKFSLPTIAEVILMQEVNLPGSHINSVRTIFRQNILGNSTCAQCRSKKVYSNVF